MNISAKAEYACLAMLELAARHELGLPVRLRDIVDRHGIPNQFLVQILLQLKNAGLVASTRGAGGGYHLTRDPEEINLADILMAVDSRFAEGAESSPANEVPLGGAPSASEALANAWRQVARAQHEILSAITLAELCQSTIGQNDTGMYYI